MSSPLRTQKLRPEAKLTHLCLPLRPSESLLEPLTAPRDTLPGGKVRHRAQGLIVADLQVCATLFTPSCLRSGVNCTLLRTCGFLLDLAHHAMCIATGQTKWSVCDIVCLMHHTHRFAGRVPAAADVQVQPERGRQVLPHRTAPQPLPVRRRAGGAGVAMNIEIIIPLSPQ